MSLSAIRPLLYTYNRLLILLLPVAARIMMVAVHENNHRKILDRAADDNKQSCGWSVGWLLVDRAVRPTRENISNLWSQPAARENNRSTSETAT